MSNSVCPDIHLKKAHFAFRQDAKDADDLLRNI